jgi:hypothetical protein
MTVRQLQVVVEMPSVQTTSAFAGSPILGVHVACGPWAEQESEKFPGPPGALQVAMQSVTSASTARRWAPACNASGGATIMTAVNQKM